MFPGIAIYGHSDHKTDITIKFALKIHSRTYLVCFISITCQPHSLRWDVIHVALIEPFLQAHMVKWLMVRCCLYKHQCRRLCVQSPVCAFYCASPHSPCGFHMESTRTPSIDFFNFTKSKVLLQSTPHIIFVDSMWTPCGAEWSRVEDTGEGLEVDW